MSSPAAVTTTKQILITGGAAESIGGSHGKHRGSRKRRGLTNATTITQVGATGATGATSAVSEVTVQPVIVATPPVVPTEPVVQQGGGSTPKPKPKPKVILDSSKKISAPTKLKIIMKQKTAPSASSTRKCRRIGVNLPKLKTQMTRHRKILQDSTTTPIETIKDVLVEAKLAKSATKAPEKLLRKMYADYQTLKQGAV